ncbi:glycoside hydrolase family 13 protein [Streptococcus parauberis]|uniref:glycoside hydrolase family 13 protein n=1 Tax=Streptococcus parauberis TaxID=1348 RepID=UPI000CCE8697|nr:alpha-glucosidase [Streptococcus parauberis]PNY20367.1 Oligo-1,6-glucosidase [Streptococcus parauberis]
MSKWWQSEIIYQIYPKSFKDSNQDGIGDIKGIIEKLDYLADLGITSIWICPIFKSPMADNGYDISDYFGIQDEFGTLEDLKELILRAKEKDIKILLDLVVNHTSDEHPWFQEALRNPHSKYRDYYIFKEGTQEPNNWRSIFGGSVWEKVSGEDSYYYHTFHKKQPDLNWENPLMRQEIFAMINTWLSIGIAGFRVDAITFIKKDLSFKSIESDGVDGLAKCTKVSRNQPGIEVFLKELNEKCFKPYKAVTVAEAPGVPYDQLEEFIGQDGFFSMIFDFKHADLDVKSGSEWFKPISWEVSDLYQILEDSQLAIQKVGWGAPFIENHDQPRATNKYLGNYATNPKAVKAMAIMYFFLRGTSFIYQGQEIGMVNFQRSGIDEFNDISSIDQYYRGMAEGLSSDQALDVINKRSRDNSRTPMQWSNQENVGFSEAKPWLAISNNKKELSVAYQEGNSDSILSFYKDMIAFKKGQNSELLNLGDISFPTRTNKNVFIYKRSLEGKSIIFYINLSDEAAIVSVEKDMRLVFGNQTAVEISNHQMVLEPFAACALEEL